MSFHWSIMWQRLGKKIPSPPGFWQCPMVSRMSGVQILFNFRCNEHPLCTKIWLSLFKIMFRIQQKDFEGMCLPYMHILHSKTYNHRWSESICQIVQANANSVSIDDDLITKSILEESLCCQDLHSKSVHKPGLWISIQFINFTLLVLNI